MQNPSAVSDDNGEWFELYNAGLDTVDISGWIFKDADNDSLSLDVDCCLNIPPNGYFLMICNWDTATNGGISNYDFIYNRSDFTLGNSDDEIIIMKERYDKTNLYIKEYADFHNLNLPNEPSILSYIKSAAGVYSFSGDKLLGGPQAGIICGKKTLIRKIHQNPLYRVLRCDKLTYEILEETLRTYLTSTKFHEDNLTLALFQRGSSRLEKIAEKFL